ncbi:amidinotransferase [Nostoc sp. UHCC 0252]|uniref:amidinotransferase n=1 Tax=Nostoc sp. UHCC 0252 TaxID=3110241 RepID=UPI002B20D592|nr:amidinotransferase [Nostoc sp. UHCC 0252]MEA5605293.1 amidinotransferase [Nostoc sp. UHCC 0252]
MDTLKTTFNSHANTLQKQQSSDLNNGVVNSYNEWDLLEEVIVGRLEKSIHPRQHIVLLGGIPQKFYNLLFWIGGNKVSHKWGIEPAQKELDEFIHILEAEGVKVRRPDIIDHTKKYATPNWSSPGMCSACPRDCFIVIGNEIIEAPMSWRSRYYEHHAYYSLFKEYSAQGAKWTSAPKPPLLDTLYDKNYKVPKDGEAMRYVINESEIVFDAADFVRCGRDIFVTKSNVTNQAGIDWLQNHLGNEYRIHIIETHSKQPMHIDTTFMPLAPGKVMINPKYIDVKKLPAILKSWDILIAPEPVIVNRGFFNETAALCSMWLSMNVLMLDEERVICERTQEPTIRALKDWGFKPIVCDFLQFNPFGGAFHCATLDVRRRGTLQSYF